MGNNYSINPQEICHHIINKNNGKVENMIQNMKLIDECITMLNTPVDEYGNTLLNISLLAHNYEIAEILIDIDGIDVNNVIRYDITTLMCLFIGIKSGT